MKINCLALRVGLFFGLALVHTVWAQPVQSYRLSVQEHAFPEDLERRSFRYFQEQTHPKTGLVLDRARTDGSIHDEGHHNTASIAATGFGLTAWCIAAERGWVSKNEFAVLIHQQVSSFTNSS